MIVLGVVGAAIFTVMTAFPLIMVLKQLAAEGVWMPLSARVVGRIWYVLGVPSDLLYNLVCGTIQFREFPKEVLFSQRIQRLVTSGSEWRRAKALRWSEFLNAVDPGHIHL